mmetsp:Transcript_8156/g.17581  ORF Transcript_8156/g.17581 Transcript_8156/m.17581 type:complete len:242 (-) Transcript_8156:597-1322(-)
MVYFFTAEYESPSSTETCPEPPVTFDVYMGKNQGENELLIRYGHPEDVWFHVDELSSAHVYFRMKPGMAMDDVPKEAVLDCATLVKANSIAGCKKSEVTVVYTRWKNLKKTHWTPDGTVGFHRPDNVRRIRVKKDNFRTKKLEKTRMEPFDDNGNTAILGEMLSKSQERRLKEIQRKKKEHNRLEQKAKKKAYQERQADKQAKSYDRLHLDNAHKMTSNKSSGVEATADATAAEEYEDDFF